MKVGIVGLGLMGGSLGLALQKTKIVSTVSGWDLSEAHKNEALELGLVHEIADISTMKQNCDIVVLAIPVEAIIATLKNDLFDAPSNLTIIDFGSTKRAILDAVPDSIRGNFVAAHPMAGTEYSGPKAAFSSLYDGATVIFCDPELTTDRHAMRAVELFSHIGMKIVFMSAAEHDHHTAIISHLPHAISFSLASGVLQQEERRHIVALGGPTFSGMIRVAKSSPVMWSDIFKQNEDELISAIDMFSDELARLKGLVASKDWQGVGEFMRKARKIREIL
ncbi:prephenate dehydrogenase [Campylobacter sp. 19-13652]|uniref:prephenate dehydrogenase n=1 Tax=Campylobacter sp. 19-13652 TaxID=2840180 RepID=UPI001C787820|nr:prephenate dehydrogenase [Campylobacter sp. 19-13652]BCX79875.1 prephenate dehydrogenase [Campylobacter sp. 19-13652]